MENSKSTLRVEVAYALPTKQQIVALEVPVGTTVRAVAMQSALDKQFSGLDLETAELGIFGKLVSKPEQQAVSDGDRIEIYRPLIADPKEVRKQRAAKVKARKAADKA